MPKNRIFIGLMLLCLTALTASAAKPDSAIVAEYLVDEWVVAGERSHTVPFRLPVDKRIQLSRLISWPECPPAEYHLYFERLAWEGALRINGRFLGTFDQPFSSFQVRIDSSWIRPGKTDTLQLDLWHQQHFAFYPKSVLGIFQPAYLLHQPYQHRATYDWVASADTVAVIAPFYRGKDFVFDRFEAARVLLHVEKAELKFVFFPFPPEAELLAMCQKMGLTVVKSIHETTELALINAYEYEPRNFPLIPRFWLKANGNRSADYGEFVNMEHQQINAIGTRSGLMLALMVLFPLLSLFLIKLLNPGFFSLQSDILLNPKLNLQRAIELTASNTGLLFFLVLLKLLNLSIFLALLMYYVRTENQWAFTNLLNDWSLLNQVFYQTNSLEALFGRSFILLVSWSLLKSAIIFLLGGSFRIKQMLEGIWGLDVVATFPVVILLNIPLAIILFMEPVWGGMVYWLMVLLLVFYLLRRLYVFYVGLERLFTFSEPVKFLYICTLNLIPYLIWL
ncbi:MAG: hypothetical protein AAF206_15350 [Bacteroidota bacterium]